jgi:hypothetical protein
MFADDTSVFTKSPDIIQLESNLNSAIGEIDKWFQNNQIILNLDKMFFIHFINKNIGNSDIKIKIGKKYNHSQRNKISGTYN